MLDKQTRVEFLKIIKALIEDNNKKRQIIKDRDIIINNLERRLERSRA